jgi:hypothetical protein
MDFREGRRYARRAGVRQRAHQVHRTAPPLRRGCCSRPRCSETWSSMEEVHALGLAKAIGVSNFTCALVMDLLKTCKGRSAAAPRSASVRSRRRDTCARSAACGEPSGDAPLPHPDHLPRLHAPLQHRRSPQCSRFIRLSVTLQQLPPSPPWASALTFRSANQAAHTPHTSHLTSHTSHLTSHTSHLTPHTSHLTPHTSHLTPHTGSRSEHDAPREYRLVHRDACG